MCIWPTEVIFLYTTKYKNVLKTVFRERTQNYKVQSLIVWDLILKVMLKEEESHGMDVSKSTISKIAANLKVDPVV